MEFQFKKILITGGSSGIGAALIAELYQRGARQFAVVGRDRSKMSVLSERFPEAEFIYIQANVGELEDIKRVIEQVQSTWGRIDILINNAGVVSAGALENISDQDIIAQQSINTTGLILLTKHALSLLKQGVDPLIMNVSSGLGFIGMPFYAPYAASKAAVRQFSEALRREWSKYGIHVMTLYPTATDTPMMHTAAVGGMDSPESVAARAIDGMIKRQIDVIMGGERMINNRKLNFEDPLAYDEKVKGLYDGMEKRAANHRSM